MSNEIEKRGAGRRGHPKTKTFCSIPSSQVYLWFETIQWVVHWGSRAIKCQLNDLLKMWIVGKWAKINQVITIFKATRMTTKDEIASWGWETCPSRPHLTQFLRFSCNVRFSIQWSFIFKVQVSHLTKYLVGHIESVIWNCLLAGVHPHFTECKPHHKPPNQPLIYYNIFPISHLHFLAVKLVSPFGDAKARCNLFVHRS